MVSSSLSCSAAAKDLLLLWHCPLKEGRSDTYYTPVRLRQDARYEEDDKYPLMHAHTCAHTQEERRMSLSEQPM